MKYASVSWHRGPLLCFAYFSSQGIVCRGSWMLGEMRRWFLEKFDRG